METPLRGKSTDGIYPRCVWCNGENYMPAVIAYSKRQVPCAAVGGCGKYLPIDYVTLKENQEDDDERSTRTEEVPAEN